MSDENKPGDLEDVIDSLGKTCQGGGDVSIGDIMEVAEQRSFGAVLLVPGLVALSPVGGVPGVPTAMGVLIVLIAGQMLLGRRSFWMPQMILRRSFSCEKVSKSLDFLRKPASWIDKVISPRLTRLTRPPAGRIVAAICTLVGLLMAPMELVPFAAAIPAAAVVAFGLALIAHDGLLVCIATIFSGATLYIIATNLLL